MIDSINFPCGCKVCYPDDKLASYVSNGIEIGKYNNGVWYWAKGIHCKCVSRFKRTRSYLVHKNI